MSFENGDVITYTLNTPSVGVVISGDITYFPTPPVLYGTTIQLSTTLPDIKQSDFITYLSFVFGAIPQANAFSRTVRFDLFSSIKNNLSNALDWSSKMDTSKLPELDFTKLLDKYSKVSIINYAEDSNDEILESYENEFNARFGQGQLDIDNQHIAGSDEIYEAPFTPMINVTSFDSQVYIPQIRWRDNAGEVEVSPKPKISILSKNLSVSDLSVGVFTDLTLTHSGETTKTASNIPFCWFAKTQYVAVVDALLDSLVFDQIAFPNVIGNPLVDRFISDYEDIFSNMKYLKQRFHLTDEDISNLDFILPIYLKKYNAYFYISKIENFKGSNTSTPVELVKIA